MAAAVVSGRRCGLLVAVRFFQGTTGVFHPLFISVWFPPQSSKQGQQPHTQPGTSGLRGPQAIRGY